MKPMKVILALFCLLLFAGIAPAQTPTAYRIAPYAAAPAYCSPLNGDVFTLTGAGPVGAVYSCTAPNVWTLLGTTPSGVWLNAQGVLVASTPFIQQTATWNAGAVTFHNFVSNITATAYASPSYLMELQVGGVDQISVDQAGNETILGTMKPLNYADTTECVSGAQPAVCTTATAGMAAIVNGTASTVVQTSAVTANSVISVIQDNSIGAKVSQTCTATGIPLMVTARTAGVSFTVGTSTAGNVAANYECFTFQIRN